MKDRAFGVQHTEASRTTTPSAANLSSALQRQIQKTYFTTETLRHEKSKAFVIDDHDSKFSEVWCKAPNTPTHQSMSFSVPPCLCGEKRLSNLALQNQHPPKNAPRKPKKSCEFTTPFPSKSALGADVKNAVK
jgi:hypothetical protein